jgi:hypothetical protein
LEDTYLLNFTSVPEIAPDAKRKMRATVEPSRPAPGFSTQAFICFIFTTHN